MRDKGMASSWYQRAADSGNAAAQVSLDGRYALGDGVTQDQGVALMWFNAATSRGSADAKKGINKIAPVMPPPSHVEEAQLPARHWKPKASQ